MPWKDFVSVITNISIYIFWFKERNEQAEFHFIFFLISFLSSIAYLYLTRVLFPVIITSIIMTGRSLCRWRSYMLLPHFEIEIWRGIHSCVTYLGHIDLTEPIALQAKPLPMSFKLKPRLDNEHDGVDSVGGETIAMNADFSFGNPLLFPAIASRLIFFFFYLFLFPYFFLSFNVRHSYCFEIKFTRHNSTVTDNICWLFLKDTHGFLRLQIFTCYRTRLFFSAMLRAWTELTIIW